MNTPLWKRDEIESPCVQICVVHPERAFAQAVIAPLMKSPIGHA